MKPPTWTKVKSLLTGRKEERKSARPPPEKSPRIVWPKKHVDDQGRLWGETEDTFYRADDDYFERTGELRPYSDVPTGKDFWRRKNGPFPWESDYAGDPPALPFVTDGRPDEPAKKRRRPGW